MPAIHCPLSLSAIHCLPDTLCPPLYPCHNQFSTLLLSISALHCLHLSEPTIHYPHATICPPLSPCQNLPYSAPLSLPALHCHPVITCPKLSPVTACRTDRKTVGLSNLTPALNCPLSLSALHCLPVTLSPPLSSVTACPSLPPSHYLQFIVPLSLLTIYSPHPNVTILPKLPSPCHCMPSYV